MIRFEPPGRQGRQENPVKPPKRQGAKNINKIPYFFIVMLFFLAPWRLGGYNIFLGVLGTLAVQIMIIKSTS
ncbi:MAG: hypothetical protein OQL11_04295 [Gammaproteobacteria bacterium]|nr:hypothetical protein [Gammaproteobacteria bacterium]